MVSTGKSFLWLRVLVTGNSKQHVVSGLKMALTVTTSQRRRKQALMYGDLGDLSLLYSTLTFVRTHSLKAEPLT